ncbi:MAG: peptidylprolyl isomerase [Bacteroidales bacterium]|nr:peptidylprolyl isomerase [Bacteroidales bacterium]
MIRYITILSALVIICFTNNQASGQKLAESVAGIVGNELILLSEIEENVNQMRSSGNRTPVEELRCQVFEESVIQKLFIDQARLDSIIVTPESVEGDLNLRLNNFITQIGSEAALESYFEKSIYEIKADLREMLIDARMVREMQATIGEGISVTPADVRRFYNSMHKDSIPLVPALVEVSIIQMDPPYNEENKLIARQRILDLRSEILGGKSFEVMARLYSEDEGTAVRGGEVGLSPRGLLAKEYANTAFSLKNNTVSKVVETEYGYHIIQLIERKGDLVNTRHILIKPRLSQADIVSATSKLDSIADLIRNDSVKFENVARLMSTHKDSRINGGKLVKGDPESRTSVFALEELDKDMYQIVRNMKVGDISQAYRTVDENNNPVFRIVRLDREIPAHEANLKDDYELLQAYALYDKQSKKYMEWIQSKFEVTYVRVSSEFKQCNFQNDKWLK